MRIGPPGARKLQSGANLSRRIASECQNFPYLGDHLLKVERGKKKNQCSKLTKQNKMRIGRNKRSLLGILARTLEIRLFIDRSKNSNGKLTIDLMLPYRSSAGEADLDLN